MIRAMVLVTTFLGMTTTLAWPQSFTSSAVDANFRVEWETASARSGRPIVRGYLYNVHTRRADNVRVKVEQLDSASRPLATRFAFVIGGISPGGRGYFEVAVPVPDATYRVSIDSFGVAGCGDG